MPFKAKTILIRGGTVVSGQTVSQQDILIRGEHISALGNLAGLTADTEINASGLLVLPGAVDTHVHFNDEFMDTISVHDYYTGTLAAAFGGVTSIVDFSNQIPGEPLINTLKAKKDEAGGMLMVHAEDNDIIEKKRAPHDQFGLDKTYLPCKKSASRGRE